MGREKHAVLSSWRLTVDTWVVKSLECCHKRKILRAASNLRQTAAGNYHRAMIVKRSGQPAYYNSSLGNPGPREESCHQSRPKLVVIHLLLTLPYQPLSFSIRAGLFIDLVIGQPFLLPQLLAQLSGLSPRRFVSCLTASRTELANQISETHFLLIGAPRMKRSHEG